MSRRPHSFAAYARRRWRALGLLLVLLLGSLLVVALADRGHDPLWEVRGAPPVAAAVSPDARLVYSLHGDDGRITRLEARHGDSGTLLWTTSMDESRALIRASEGGVAVATDFPRAFLTRYRDDNSVRFKVPLEGNPRAMAADGPLLALALQGPGNPVLVYDTEGLVRVHRFDQFVNSIDARGGHIAVGTGAGGIMVLDDSGERVLEVSLPISVRSVRLDASGTRLAVGGFSLVPGDLSGIVALFDTEGESPLTWSRETRVGIGLVDIDARGTMVVAVEESPPRNRVLAFDGATGEPRWIVTTAGEIAQDDAGSFGGVAIAPDGRTVALSTIRDRIHMVDAATGVEQWSYRAHGSLGLAFGRDAPGSFVATARLSPQGPYDALLLFSPTEEPVTARLPLLAAGLLLLYALVATTMLAVGYARRRSGLR